ncbi:MAG: hypothetical protein HXX17_07580 [Geobacteraceae bacterium]|nr:hypothetical protein [Geobacteraceae bacterium]
MIRLAGNTPLFSSKGDQLSALTHLNALDPPQKEAIYRGLIPPRLLNLLSIPSGGDTSGRIRIVAPEGLSLARIEVRANPLDRRTVFFLDIAETHYNQMELSFCIINDPSAVRFDVDIDEKGDDNCFCTLGRNIPEEIRAMNAGLYPNQTSRGLRMFGEFFYTFERFVDSLGMEIITAEPLTYDNAVRYERYGFDYLSGRRMMLEIDREFRPGGILFRKLDGSTPFRQPGMERTVHGRSWAIHDGILDEPWDEMSYNEILDSPWEDVKIYRMVGRPADVRTFTPQT